MSFALRTPPRWQLGATTLALGILLSAIFAALLFTVHRGLHEEIRQAVIRRDASVLQPVAQNQITMTEERTRSTTVRPEEFSSAVLSSAQQEGMLAVAVFDPQGDLVRALPDSLIFAELPVTDYLAMLRGETISRFHPSFHLDRYFRGAERNASAPVMEVIIPLTSRLSPAPIGYAQYYMDARALSVELATIQQRLQRQVSLSFAAGVGLLSIVLLLAYLGMRRSQRIVAERNDRLARTNFELTLAAKASALGQITSHLIHGLQGSVSELRVAVSSGTPDLTSAAKHADRMQSLISEVVALLGDSRVGANFELSGDDLADIILARSHALVQARQIRLTVSNRLTHGVPSNEGSLICLVAANLIQNAASAVASGSRIDVELKQSDGHVRLIVADDGPGIPEAVRDRLFEPGVTGRLGGTGLGLAISRLIARQLNGDLDLVATSALGTVFQLSVPQKATRT